jgi:MATE family multidrug resistance protein
MTSTTETADSFASRHPRGGLREVFTLAYPVILTQMSATAMGVVDSAMVGRLGATELAAVGFGAIWMWTIFSFFFGTTGGIQTFVSQADGAGDPRACGRWTWQGAYAVVPASAICVGLMIPWIPSALGVLGPSAELRAAAEAYVSTRIWGEVGFAFVMVWTAYFRGIGDTRTPLYVTLLANAVNAILDYGLIFGHWGLPAWGVAGAGTATAIGQWIAAAVLFFAFQRQKHRSRYATSWVAPDRVAIRRFLRTAVPMGGQWFIEMSAFAVFTTVVARMGDSSMAASQAFVMLLSLSFMQAHGISIAAGTLVGRYVGAQDPEAAKRSFRTAVHLGLGLGGVVAALFVTIPTPLLRIFTDDPAVMTLGRPLLLLGALFQICDAVVIISEGSLRGAGDTRIPFLMQTCFGWLLFLPLGYGLGVTLGYGLTGAWAGGTISIAVLAVLLLRRFNSGAWERIQI